MEGDNQMARVTARPWIGSLLAALGWLTVGAGVLSAQALDERNRVELSLRDGTKVIALGAPVSNGAPPSSQYYYLPTGLRLAQRPDSTPEFLFLQYTTDAAASEGGIQGALLHALMVWGLTEKQMEEANTELQGIKRGARLMGAAQVEPEGQNGSFRVISATMSNNQRARSVVLSGKAAILPGSRMAIAADLDAYGAQLLAATFKKTSSITDISLELNFAYTALVPAAKGEVRVDWSRFQSQYDSLAADYKRTHTSTTTETDCILIFCASDETPNYSYSYNEVRNQFDYLAEKRIVTFNFEENVEDERVGAIREAFTKYFLAQFAEPTGSQLPPPKTDSARAAGVPDDVRQGDGYTYRRTQRSVKSERKTQVFRLDYRLAFKRPMSLVGNLASWYDAVRDNPKCVASVNLNDPFFERYDVRFRVDFDAPKELFASTINYVTLTLHKDRPDGAPFEKSVTIDEEYIKKNGVIAALTYARGTDNDPSLFKYKVQWSTKGGLVYPEQPQWQTSNGIQAVTLAPPVTPRKIEFEGNLQELQQSGFTRATAQVRYRKFGREFEENIQLPLGGNTPMASATIFTDRGEKGYAYRIVLHHKEQGRLALPWSPQVGDDYIYAAIPADMMVRTELVTAARTAASETVTNVLDQFRDVLGTGGTQ